MKVHLDEEECQFLLDTAPEDSGMGKPITLTAFCVRLAGKIRELMAVEPTVLAERTPEQIAAILAKESEKAALQLAAMKAGKKWQKIDPDALNAAMSKLVNKQ